MTEEKVDVKIIEDEDEAGEEVSSEDLTDSNEEQEDAEALQQELRDAKDKFVRLYAEFDNYKKRTTRDMQEFRKFANEAMAKELLPVIDNLERAIDSFDSTQENAQESILEGVKMTHGEILKVLNKFHVTQVQAMGEPFDPTYHEAVGQEESDEYDSNVVLKEFQKGYVLHGRLLRPAMVVVAKAKPKEEPVAEVSDEAEADGAEETSDISENGAETPDGNDNSEEK